MALKTVIETTDGLDEAVAKLYTETDGKYVLQIEGVDAHPEVAALKNAFEATKANLVTAKADRDKFKTLTDGVPEDFSLEKWEKLKDGRADEAALIALRQKLEAERDEWKGKFEQQVETTRKNAIERDLTQELAAGGVTDPMLQTAARAVLADKVQASEDGTMKIDIGLAPMDFGEGVKRFLAGDGKAFVTPAKGSGSKSGDGNGGAITKEQFAQMGDKERTELLRSDPEKFKELSAP